MKGPEAEGAVVGTCDEGFFVDERHAVDTSFCESLRGSWCGIFAGGARIEVLLATFASASATENELSLLNDFPQASGTVSGTDADAAFLR